MITVSYNLQTLVLVYIGWNFPYNGIFFKFKMFLSRLWLKTPQVSVHLFFCNWRLHFHIHEFCRLYCTTAGAGGKYEGMKIAELRADILSNSSTGLSDGRSSCESTILYHTHMFFIWIYNPTSHSYVLHMNLQSSITLICSSYESTTQHHTHLSLIWSIILHHTYMISL